MDKIKIRISKKDYNELIEKTITDIMTDHNVSYDTACIMLYFSDAYNNTDFIIEG